MLKHREGMSKKLHFVACCPPCQRSSETGRCFGGARLCVCPCTNCKTTEQKL